MDLLNRKYMMTIKMEANILLWIRGNLTVHLSLSLSLNTLLFSFAIITIVISYKDDYVDNPVQLMFMLLQLRHLQVDAMIELFMSRRIAEQVAATPMFS